MSPVNLQNTEIGFAYKTDQELKQAKLLYSVMNIGWLSRAGAAILPLALKFRMPVKELISKTIFRQFVGGESLPDTEPVRAKLNESNVKAILDYGAEGKETEESFDLASKEFVSLIEYASQKRDVPFISIKITGMARFGLLEKISSGLIESGPALKISAGVLSEAELNELQRVVNRIDAICKIAEEKNTGVLIDAEESWIQDVIDAIAQEMMQKYNHTRAIVFNTIQFYRTERLSFLGTCLKDAKEKGYHLGVKIVRGAYMEKERSRAIAMGYPSPIQPDKASTDKDFNSGLELCIANLDIIHVIVASHNEYSNFLAIKLLKKYGCERNHPHVHFSQLYGMSDNITFNLAKGGFSVSKYLPYGPIEDVIPYLMRRAQENTSMSGQTSRELLFISQEIKRRKSSGS